MLRRAQISVFIIIGILVIAIFGFMYFITSEVGKIKLETEANRIVDAILATTPINYYVTLCLEEATKSALNVSGMHGGLIDLGQQNFINFKDNPVQYYLYFKPDYYDYGYSYGNSYQYPCNTNMPNYNVTPAYCAFLNNLTKFTNLTYTTLGVSSPPMLCRETGREISVCTEGMSSYFNVTVQGWPLPTSYINTRFYGNGSIEEQIGELIANETANCSQGILNISASNLTAFKKFNITVGNINISTVFGFNGVEVSADYPLLIKIQDFEPVIRILKFRYFSPVRYKYVYLLARWIAEQERKELDFNITKDWARNHAYALPGFSVTTERTSTNNATIVTITDNDPLHFLRAGPFVFNFAIENRPPVLDYIPEYDEGAYTDVLKRNYDLYVVEGDTVEIHPKGYDPDGDAINYSYSGWKETEDAYFDETADDNCRQNPENCIIINKSKAPHNWTKSEKYAHEYPSASYKTNHSDIGIHNLTVCVYEENNPEMKDCQVVRILVDDVFIVVANVTMTRCFADMTNNTLISIEDPICLDADVIDYFNPGITNYLWQIAEESSTRTIYEGGNDSVKLPDYEHNLYEPGKINYFNSIGSKTFNLLVTRGLGPTATTGAASVNAVAKVCIPHNSSSNPPPIPAAIPSFPFNNLDYKWEKNSPYTSYWDPFLANHACCTGDPSDPGGNWNYADEGTECFRYEEYGWYNATFLDIAEQANVTVQYVQTTYDKEDGTKNTPANYNLTNDIILRNFTSYCSGKSGNICNSSITETFSNITACADNVVLSQLLRCEGANITANYLSAGQNPQCINFTNTTFEQYAGINDSAICAPARCTNYNEENPGSYMSGRGTENAFWLCNATCYEGACKKPIECENCREKSSCSKTPDADPLDTSGFANYKIRQNISGASWNCSAGIYEDRCGIKTNFILQDSCETEGGDILYEQNCRLQKSNYPDINYTEIFNCAKITDFEIGATIEYSDSGNICTPGKKSVCSEGACISKDLSNQQLKESCTSDKKFVGVDFWDSNSNGISESCKYKDPIDPDSNKHACTVCGGNWDSTNNCCCGDDGETWQPYGIGGICSPSC